jgi:small subunit ribosomal protein S7
MADKFTASAKQLKPDPRFGSVLVSKFINCLMHDGKKSIAQAVFYGAMEVIAEKMKEQDALEVFTTAVENCRPGIEVRSRRVGGANYQVPTNVNSKRGQSLAIRWILDAARGKKGRPMHLKLADELMAAYRREGSAMNTREQMHRMADANKAFAHFAF